MICAAGVGGGGGGGGDDDDDDYHHLMHTQGRCVRRCDGVHWQRGVLGGGGGAGAAAGVRREGDVVALMLGVINAISLLFFTWHAAPF